MMAYDYFQGHSPNIRRVHKRWINHQVQLRRHLRDSTDPFAMSTTEFHRLYRMPQHQLMNVVELVRPYIRVREATVYIPLEIKVLCTIGFYAAGSYQRGHGRSADLNVSQTMASRSIHEVTVALNNPDLLTRLIRFPATLAERQAIVARNLALGKPGTLGYIDGTLVRIVPPRTLEKQVYRSRKGLCAVNVQIVCSSDLYIMNVNARFPGSANDPHIYRSSPVREAMRNAFQENRCWLLGDSAYPHEPWLMLPLPHAEAGTPEYFYTRVHCRCRNAVERCIGVLKARWRCLLADRSLHYEPEKVGLIVNACVGLHNFLIQAGAPEPLPILEDLGHDEPEEPLEDLELLHQADEVRRYLIEYVMAQRRVLQEGD